MNSNKDGAGTNELYERIYAMFIEYSFSAVKSHCTLDEIKQLNTEVKFDERIIWEMNDKLDKRKNEYYDAVRKILNEVESKYDLINKTQMLSEAKILESILKSANLPLDSLLSMDEIMRSTNPLLSFIKQNSIGFFKDTNARLLEHNKELMREINEIKSVNKINTII